MDYAAGVVFESNGTVYFRGMDVAGNVSAITIYVVSNIDKVPPVIELAGDNTTPLQSSTLTASTEEGLDILWSTDNAFWTAYTAPLEITANGIYYFKATDAAGNTGAASISFENIDTDAPVIELVGDNTTPLQSSTLTATTEEGVDILWSTDNASWTEYTAPLEITSNGTWHFKATDAAGNTGTASISFENIDTDAPAAPVASANVTNPTNGAVTVTAVFSEDSAVKQYSLDNGDTWQDYSNGVVFEVNGSVLFKAMDVAGNSAFSAYDVSNIYKNALILKLESGWNLVSFQFVLHPDDIASLLELHPFAVENESYVRVAALEANQGYWFYVKDLMFFILYPMEKAPENMPVAGEWSLIGAEEGMPSWLRQDTQLLQWDDGQKGFVPAETPESGRGYWVFEP